ncbi:MAG: hypothetical protein ACFFDP_12025 [Promethearchaeota archaeon]
MPEPPDEIRRAISRFNQLRSPEAYAELIVFDTNELHVRFTGVFCRSCGVLDYFEDLIFELDSTTPINLSVIDFEQEDEATFKVRYRITYQPRRCAR